MCAPCTYERYSFGYFQNMRVVLFLNSIHPEIVLPVPEVTVTSYSLKLDFLEKYWTDLDNSKCLRFATRRHVEHIWNCPNRFSISRENPVLVNKKCQWLLGQVIISDGPLSLYKIRNNWPTLDKNSIACIELCLNSRDHLNLILLGVFCSGVPCACSEK